MATVNWVGGSGDWNTATNWLDATTLTNHVPVASDDAVIDVAAVSVTHSTGTHTVQSLTINDPFTLSGGTLIVTGKLVQQNANTFTITAGILRSATVVGGGGAVLVAAGGTLDGVTLGATVGGVPTPATVQSNSPGFTVTGGLTFANGSLIDLGNPMSLTGGDQTLGGTGEIRFRGTAAGIYNSSQTTFGPRLTIHRSDANTSDINIAFGSITNQGTIRADAGGQIRVTGNTSLTNATSGVLSADGGTLSLATAWSNAGQIVVNNSTLNLGGNFTTAGIGSIMRTGGTINLVGLLDNTGSTFTLDAASGSWIMGANGKLRRGSLVTSSGTVLVANNGTLDGLTLGATVGGVPASATVQCDSYVFFVTDGLTFANGSLVDLANDMILVGDQALGGDGEIRFRASGGITNYDETTFGPGLRIHRSDASSSVINIVSGSITNQGTIRADAGGQILVGGNSSLTNAVGGVLSADGGTLSLATAWSNAGQIVVNNSTLNLGGSFTTAGLGAYTRMGGTINLVGLLDNTGSTFALDALTGSWNLANSPYSTLIPPELRGGNLVTSGGAALVPKTTGSTIAILNGVTLGATVGGVPVSATVLQAVGTNPLEVTGGLTFANGSLVDISSGMTFVGNQTVGGDGEILLRATSTGITNYDQTTIGPGLTINSYASVGSISGGSITNQGTIRTASGQLSVVGTTFTNAVGGVLGAAGGKVIATSITNDGTINVTGGTCNLGGSWFNTGLFQVSGGTLNPGGTWSNTGSFQISGGTLNLGGSFTTADIGAFTNTGGIVNLTGTLDNTGGTLSLDAATGSWFMVGGTIVGGRVSISGTAELVAGLQEGSISTRNFLNGVTLAGTVTGFNLDVTDGLTLELGRIDVVSLLFNGTQTLGGAGEVDFSTNDPRNTARVSNGATLTVGPGVTVRGVTGFFGSTTSGRILNQGTIAAYGGGTLKVQGISNFVSGTLTGGTWQVSGDSILRLIGVSISTNAADILRDGANARLFSDAGSTNVLAGIAINTAAGRLRLLSGASLATSASSINNQGSLMVGSGSTFTVNGDFLSAGDTTVDGSLIASTVTVGQAGTLSGSGTVTGNVVNNGQVLPGTSPGSLSVTGNYTQGETGRLDIELGGSSAGSQYDQLSISGAATLDGTLDIRLVDGFGPATGQQFEIMTFANRNGTFSNVTGLSQGHFPLFGLAVNSANVELNALVNGTDLAFDSFQGGTIATSAMPGQNVSLTYSVKNLSDPPAVGNWIDSVYLSRDGVLDPSDSLLTRVEHVGGVAGLGSYTVTATAPLPPLANGGYRVIVVADSRGLVSDADRANNTGVSAQAINVTVPLLTLGTPLNGSIIPGQDLYYRVLVPPGADVTLAADFAAPPGAEVSVRFAALPDQTNRDDASPAGQLDSRLLLSNTQGGSYYIRLHGREDAAGSVAFALIAAASGFEIMSVSPLRGSNRSLPAIITLQGAHFTPLTQIQLRQAGGPTRTAQSVEFISDNKLVAKVDLTDLPIGNYEVVADDASQTAIALDAFTVTDRDVGGTGAWISALGICRVGCAIKLKLGYYNTSDSPLPAPLVQIRATDVGPGQETTGSLTIDNLPGFLPGSYSHEFDPFKTYSTLPTPGTSRFDLFIIEPSQTPMNWDSQKAPLRPDTIPLAVWDAVWDNLRPQLGETLADFWQFLSITASKLRAAGGERVDAIDRLFSFELQRANNMPAVPVPATAVDVAFPAPGLPLVFGRGLGESLTGRSRQGRLGRGWTDNFDISIREDATTGTATLTQGSIVRFFGRRPDGSYENVPGDFGALSKVNGAFQLRESTGELIGFRADGLLDFLQDNNGNRITAGYAGAQLTNLTHSNGAALTLAYNGQGRIRQVTDPAGGVATYVYDASGEHLIRVTTTAGTTEYTYAADITGPRAHSLTSITFLDATHLFFDYDSKGRLVRQQGDGGEETLRFTYDTASFSVTDAHDQITTYFYDDSFRIRRVRDPLGRLSYINYDAANNPVIIGAAGGGEAHLGYDELGNPTAVQNPIGETQAFAYESDHSRLVNFEDALHHATQFNHDANGNLLTTTHADNSMEQYTYDAQGNIVGTVNRLGQVIQYTYNSRGQVTRKDLPNGTHVDYTYNARAKLEMVIDASGTTLLEYLDPQDPDLITKITYPTGRFLQYTYQNGRRTRMVDQSGFVVNYAYDVAGRLDVMRDGSGSVIVDYDYDPLGRLNRETRGNFTVTTYDYDNAGQLVDITHRAPDTSIQSQFVYAYDNLGRRTSVTTLEGVTTYGYDGAGRLTSVLLPTGRVLTYAYDAAGNRTVAGDDGATTAYTINDLNQYVAFGSTGQTFDLAGNLAFSTSAAGSSSYLYDPEGRMVSQVTPTGTWTYQYDALGNRIAGTHDGVRTEYLVDPFGLENVVGEYDGAGNLQAHYVHGLGLTSRVDGAGQSAFYQFDAAGNTTQLTRADGTVLNAYDYLPFGEALSASESVANPFKFVGQFGVMREGSGIDYMRNRWYDPTQGRFTQVDPIGLAGGTNSYAYVRNDPESFVDPTGLASLAALAASAGRLATGGYIGQSSGAAVSAVPASATETTFGVGKVVQDINSVWKAEQAALAEARALAQVAEAASMRAALLSDVKDTAIAVLAIAEVAAIVLASQYVQQSVGAAITGHEIGCTPGIPESIQVCDPNINFLTGEHFQTISVQRRNVSRDPNDIVGPAGFGAEGFVPPQATLPYLIEFQNLPAAEGPAAEVVVTQVLDANFDLDTFELDEFGFGDITVPVPAGRQSYSTRIDVRSTRGVFVDVTAGLDRTTRTVTWRFLAIDPETLDLPISPFVGFLPPDQVAPEGEGFVSYHVRPRTGLATGTEIRSVGVIVFDTNAPIATNQVNPDDPSQGTDPNKEALVTIDDGPPASSVGPLPTITNTATFPVSWAGLDDAGGTPGSGVATFDIFVSEDGGEFLPWLTATELAGSDYLGEFGHTYAFYSVATDNVGHRELPPEVADTLTELVPGAGAPRVVAIYARGSDWDVVFREHLADLGVGDGALGFALPLNNSQVGTLAQPNNLPWVNLNQLAITFSEDVTLTGESLSLVGASKLSAPPAATGFEYDGDSFTATWTFAAPLPRNKYLIQLSSSAITDMEENELDGEWQSPATDLPSGDGTAGGDFDFRFNVLPADVNGTGTVSTAEANAIRIHHDLVPGDALYNYREDLDGSGMISSDDFDVARMRLNTTTSGLASPTAIGPAQAAAPTATLANTSAIWFPLHEGATMGPAVAPSQTRSLATSASLRERAPVVAKVFEQLETQAQHTARNLAQANLGISFKAQGPRRVDDELVYLLAADQARFGIADSFLGHETKKS